MTPGRLDQRPVASGRSVAGHLMLALVATVVVPPLLAWGLHAQRARQTRRALQASVVAVRDARPTRRSHEHATVVCGQGRVPDIDRRTAIDRGLDGSWPTHAAWLEVLSRSAYGTRVLATDAWGYCSLFRTGGRGADVLLSAGANGLIETPLERSIAGGDDILVTVD